MRSNLFMRSTLKNNVILMAGGMWAGMICLAAMLLLAGCASQPAGGGPEKPKRLTVVPKWERFERVFTSLIPYTNAPQYVHFTVTFNSPLGTSHRVPGFWDGGTTWRVRFSPNQAGEWTYATECSEVIDLGLHNLTGSFLCTAPTGKNRWSQHGNLRVYPEGRYLMHDDLTPFFWLGDTAWNGPLLSTDADWAFYLKERARQKFNAIQFVCAQWRAAPDGNRDNQKAYTGKERIQINPEFFQKLDRKIEEMNRAGFLAVPVLLWAINGGSNPQVNPGVSLPEDQAIILARYMVARWGGNHVVWILGGDGDYRGEKAEKWKRIGRGVFGDIHHAPVTTHPGGKMWILNEFTKETWYDICAYQSAHNTSDDNLKWITSGPAATDWKKEPARPFISLEAPYENHNGSGGKPMNDYDVRRAHYLSLLNTPPVGITYGAHGVWGWDDGTQPPIDHPKSGIPLPWKKALTMPGAEQMKILVEFFTSIDFHRLKPAPQLLMSQPGTADPKRFISAAMTEQKDLGVIYVPADRSVEISLAQLSSMAGGSPQLTWVNPRTGERRGVAAVVGEKSCQVPVPDEKDWLLLITSGKSN
jgi:hypothetical protein